MKFHITENGTLDLVTRVDNISLTEHLINGEPAEYTIDSGIPFIKLSPVELERLKVLLNKGETHGRTEKDL